MSDTVKYTIGRPIPGGQMKKNELVAVPFQGDVIEAVPNDRGIWSPVKRICERFGINPDGQRTKLLAKPWANTEMVSVLDSAGRNIEMFCIERESLPMWLATIEASRVKPEVRPLLEVYQTKAARALADYFLGRAQPAPAHSELNAALLPLMGEIARLRDELGLLKRQVSEGPADSPWAAREVGIRLGIRERARNVWPDAPEQELKKITSRVKSLAWRRRIDVEQPFHAGPLVIDQVHLPLVDEVVERARREYAVRERSSEQIYPLFDGPAARAQG